MLLKIEDLHTNYGAIHALKGISLEVNEGEIVCLIGSNGAGKTTLVNSIVGIVKSSSGTITFDGKDITHVPAHAMTKEGIGISPEGREVFPELTVEENLRIGAFVVKDENKIKESYERVYELFPRLKERITQQAGTLSGGEQQMLAVGRALMSNPKMILLDEPSLGTCSELCRDDLRHDRKDQQTGGYGSSDRAERKYGASGFAESLCIGERSRKYVWQSQ